MDNFLFQILLTRRPRQISEQERQDLSHPLTERDYIRLVLLDAVLATLFFVCHRFLWSKDQICCYYSNTYLEILKVYLQSNFPNLSVFESSCPPPTSLRRMVEASQCPLELLNVKQGKLCISIFIVFGLTRSGLEHKSTVSAVNALLTRLPSTIVIQRAGTARNVS